MKVIGITELCEPWLYAAALPCLTGSSCPSSTSGKSIPLAPAQSRCSNSSATAFLNFRQASPVSIFNVRLSVCAQDPLDVWWHLDQFAKLPNTAFRPNHPVKAIRFYEC